MAGGTCNHFFHAVYSAPNLERDARGAGPRLVDSLIDHRVTAHNHRSQNVTTSKPNPRFIGLREAPYQFCG